MAQILVIDDDKDVMETIEMFLDGFGHKVACLDSAENALEWVKSHEVDLLITDIMMPKMNGLELIENFLKISPDSKILAISGGGGRGGIVQSIALDQAMELGAEKALTKPFTKEVLLKRVDQLLMR